MGPFGPLRPDGQAARARARKERQRWTDDDENPPLTDLAHIYGGTCEGMKESSGRIVMDTVAHQSQQAHWCSRMLCHLVDRLDRLLRLVCHCVHDYPS